MHYANASSKMTPLNLRETVSTALESMTLQESYASEEGDFQDAVMESIRVSLNDAGFTGISISGSVGGTNRPRIDLLGTNMWPDVEISAAGHERLAIELKLIRPDASLPGGIKEAVGQAFIYRLKYSESIVFIVSYRPGDDRLHEYDDALIDWCEKAGIKFILRNKH